MDIIGIKLMNECAAIMLICALMIVGHVNLRSLVGIFAIQSLLLAAISAIAAATFHNHHLYYMTALIVAVKVVAIPCMLLRVINRLTIKREVDFYVNIPISFIISCGLIVLSYYIEQNVIRLTGGQFINHCLSISLAILLIGNFIMIGRKKAVTQIIGLLIMENGLFLATLSLTSGMPMVIELGIAFDVLVGVLIMGVFVFRITKTFVSSDTSKLSALKG